MNSFRLQSNPTSTFAYSQLNKTQALLNKNIQRLSSGLRINSAADDTAGSAMATRMTNQIRGMHQANRNSRDANNLLATAEAGLNNIGDLLAQMRELSVQAATDTLNDTDRASIDLEFQSLKNELTRIASVTEHNGMNLLNGTYQTGTGEAAPVSLANSQNSLTADAYDQKINWIKEEHLIQNLDHKPSVFKSRVYLRAQGCTNLSMFLYTKKPTTPRVPKKIKRANPINILPPAPMPCGFS